MSYPVLALDVATGSASVCLITESGAVFTAQAEAGKQHSQIVLPLLQDVLKQAQLDWSDLGMLALGQGPGSFTGLRIAAAILAGVNASLKLPIWGLSSLAITAVQSDIQTPVWVLEDARAGEVFTGYYKQGIALQKEQCQLWSDIESIPADMFVAHQDAPVSLQGWQRLPLKKKRADALAALMQSQWDKVDHTAHSQWIQPVYLQLSQAEKNMQHA